MTQILGRPGKPHSKKPGTLQNKASKFKERSLPSWAACGAILNAQKSDQEEETVETLQQNSGTVCIYFNQCNIYANIQHILYVFNVYMHKYMQADKNKYNTRRDGCVHGDTVALSDV